MAKNTETTTKLKVDISELKSNLQEANRQIALTNSKFKESVAGMDKFTDSADGLTAKITQLKSVNQNYEKILNEVQKKYDEVAKSEGENSEAAQNLQIKINNLKAAIKGNDSAISKYQKNLDEIGKDSEDSAKDTGKLADALDDAGDDAKAAEKSLKNVNEKIEDTGDKSEESSGKLKGFLGSLGKGILGGIGAAVTGLAAGLSAATENSKEFNDNMAKLSSAAKDGGYSAEFASDSFENMYGVLGDETAANTTVSNFMAMGTSTESLNTLLNASAGIWAKYGDSIPLDGLAESVNETAKVGKVTGNLADALNWAGVNEDDFNEQLEKCSDEQERQRLLVDTLNGLYGDLGKEYKTNNSAIISLNKSQMKMKKSIADIGTAFTPVLAMFTEMGVGLLSKIVPDVENLAFAFTDLIDGVDGADEKIGTSIGNILTTISDSILKALPQLAGVGVTIVSSLASGISENSGGIVDAAGEIVTTLADGIVQIAPGLLTSVGTIVFQVADKLIELAPKLLMSAIELFSGLTIALTDIDLGESVSQLINDAISTMDESLPDILNAATDLFMQIVDAIPQTIKSLGGALPGIINNITNFLKKSVPKITDAAIKMLMGLVDSIPDIIDAVVEVLPGIIQAIINYFTTAIPTFFSCAVRFFMALVRAIPKIVLVLIQKIPDILNAIVEGLAPLAQKFAEKIGECVDKVKEWAENVKTAFAEKITEIIDSIVQFFSELPEKIGYAIGAVIGTLGTWAVDVKNWVTEEVPLIIDNIVQFFSELPGRVWEWLTETVNKVIAWGSDMKTKATETATDFLNNVVNTIKDLPGKVWAWLNTTITKAANFARELPKKGTQAARDLYDNIVNKVKEIPDEIYEVGKNIVEGLWNGINDMTGWVKEKISGFSDSVLEGIKDFFGVHSPSVVMEKQVGQFLPMGLAEGIKDKMNTAVNAMRTMGQKMLVPAQNLKNSLNADKRSATVGTNSVVQNFTQNNYSPKALSRLEIYRQSKNLLKGARV